MPLDERQISSTISSWSAEELDSMPAYSMAMPFESDPNPNPMEHLGAMLDMTTDFDWVCAPIRVLFLEKDVLFSPDSRLSNLTNHCD
jgi:hypothetical protein